MRIVVPITGELISYESGNPDNPVQPINFRKLVPKELNNFSWEAVSYNFEAGTVELEIVVEKGPKQIGFPPEGEIEKPEHFRPETGAEFNQRKTDTENALRNIFGDNTTDELYQMAGESKLKRYME